MSTNVIMPALGMSQEKGTLLQWFVTEGQSVIKGERLMEIETDKVAVELEAPASGTLANVTAVPGDVIPVGETIALILSAGEPPPDRRERGRDATADRLGGSRLAPNPGVSPLAARIAAEHNLDLTKVKPRGDRIEKADVLAHLKVGDALSEGLRLPRASPSARRIARERGLEIRSIQGSGPGGAVLRKDVLAWEDPSFPPETATDVISASPTQRVMAERMTESWTTTPHFFLFRDVSAARLVSWRERTRLPDGLKVTYNDLLVKLVAAALLKHPLANAEWRQGKILLRSEINICLAVATEAGLVAPVIHRADCLSLREVAIQRQDVVQRAQAGKLRPADVQGGTFTLSNLGMYGVDAFAAIINPHQAAILAVGHITERVVAKLGRPEITPMMTLCLCCDHRVLDGARGAEFLATTAGLIEEPLSLLD